MVFFRCIFEIFLLFVVALSVLSPLLQTRSVTIPFFSPRGVAIDASRYWPETVDPDDSSTMGNIKKCLNEKGGYYSVDRPPGNPVYVMVSAWLAFWGQKIWKDVPLLHLLQYFSIFWMFGAIVLLYLKLAPQLHRPLLRVGVILNFILHPLFIWHTSSIVEENFTLFCFLSAWKLAEFVNWRMPALVIYAMAVGSKFTALGLAPIILSEFIEKDNVQKISSLLKIFIIPILMMGLITFLLLLPALTSTGMNLFKLFNNNFNGVSDPKQKADIALFYARSTITWWIPMGMALCIEYFNDFRQRHALRLISSADIFLIPLVFFCFVPTQWGVAILGAAAALSLFVGFVRTQYHLENRLEYWKIVAIAFACAALMGFLILYPYSRSYLLLMLIPLLFLMSKRFKSPLFWLVTAVFTFTSMFFYYQITVKKILLHQHGYYCALLEKRTCEYNDHGFVFSPDKYEIFFPWTKR